MSGTGGLGPGFEARSFEEFYRCEYASVVRIAFALCGKAHLAEELAGDAFLAAYRNWERVRGLDDPGGWLRRVVTNRAISGFRRRMTELRTLAALARRGSAQVLLPEPDQELWAAVRSLPARQAQVMTLMYLDDLTAAQVAGILGCGEETVRTHARRARVTLAKHLGIAEEDN